MKGHPAELLCQKYLKRFLVLMHRKNTTIFMENLLTKPISEKLIFARQYTSGSKSPNSEEMASSNRLYQMETV